MEPGPDAAGEGDVDPPLDPHPLAAPDGSEDWTHGSSDDTIEPQRGDGAAGPSESGASDAGDAGDGFGEPVGDEDAPQDDALEARARARQAREARVARERLEARVLIAGAVLGGVTVVGFLLLLEHL